MKYTIDHTQAHKLRDWFNTGRGVTRWENQEIGGGSHPREYFAPGDITTSNNWRYGNPTTCEPSDFAVETFEPIETFNGRFKAMYWGPWIAKGTEARAQRLCLKYKLPADSYRWEHAEPGYVTVTIGRSVLKPFTTTTTEGGQS